MYSKDSSARETAMRVGLGTITRRFLLELNIHVASRVVGIGPVVDEDEESCHRIISDLNASIDLSPVRVAGKKAELEMISVIEKAKKEGNTLGGTFEVYASGLPIGLGSYVQWDRRLEAAIGASFLSLNAIKGVEVGLGFSAAKTFGSLSHDEIHPGIKPNSFVYSTNRSGGIDGGMSTGQPLVIRAAMKPLATLMRPLHSVDVNTHEPTPAHIERSDVCAVPAAAVIGESLLSLVLADAILEKFGGDSMEEVCQRVREWNDKHVTG